MDEALPRRVAARYLIRQAAYDIALTDSFRGRSASLRDFTPEVLAAFGDGFLLDDMVRTAGFGNFRKKLKRVWEFVKRAPQAWEKVKSFFKIDDIKQLPDVIREWAKKGKTALKKIIKRMTEAFPLSLYFVDRGKMPGLTDLLKRIVASSPKLQKALSTVNTRIVQPLDRWIEKYIPNLSRPLKAAVFIFIWLNVVEITWDFQALLLGFTGGLSLGELFSSFPESSIGFLMTFFGIGYGFLPVMVMARILWLVANKYATWVPGKGLKVHWDRITGDRSQRSELVPA
jgi:hypothetical protein